MYGRTEANHLVSLTFFLFCKKKEKKKKKKTAVLNGPRVIATTIA